VQDEDRQQSYQVGYARVSTVEQIMDLQQDALRKAGCSRIFTDTVSGAHTDRAGLVQTLGFLRAGDTLVVWRLDRLGRSLKHLLETVTILHDRGIGFISLTEHIDTTSSGKLIFHIFGALAEFERDLIRERTQAGLQAARARGRRGGRPRLLAGAKKLAMVQAMYDDKSNTIDDICQTLHISRATMYRYLKANRVAAETTTFTKNL
jgi:DNA invertase Pin-like site-specific DNA recombinase